MLDAAVGEIDDGVTAIPADVTRDAYLNALHDVIAQRVSRQDVLYANAARRQGAALVTMTPAHLDSLLATNGTGQTLSVQMVIRLGPVDSSIIIGDSTDTIGGVHGFSGYGATETAVRNATGPKLGPRPARSQHPRKCPLPPPAGHAGGAERADWRRRRRRQRLGRRPDPLYCIGHPRDVAGAAAFLAFDDNDLVNGSELFVDSGYAQVQNRPGVTSRLR